MIQRIRRPEEDVELSGGMGRPRTTGWWRYRETSSAPRWWYGDTAIKDGEEVEEVWGDRERLNGGGMVRPRLSMQRRRWRYRETTSD